MTIADSVHGDAVQLHEKKRFAPLPVLDGLRATAIILVLIAHSGLDKIVPGGLGVTIFFFLSGYLITSLMRSEMDRKGKLDIKKFYIRRALRIFPPLYITLCIFLICVLCGLYPAPLDPVGVVLQFTHLANYAGLLNRGPGLPSMPLWSLAVEEHFYLIFPLAYLLFSRRLDGKSQGLVILGLCAVALGVRIVIASMLQSRGQDLHDSEIYNWTHTRFDSILFGCILAVWSNPAMDDDSKSYLPKTWHFLAAIGAIFFCLALRNDFFRQTARYTIQGLALFVIFSYIIRLKKGFMYEILCSKPMKIIGLLSYTIYLANLFVLGGLETRFPHVPTAVRSSIGLVITLGYAGLMYLLVERPISRMRAKMH